jgi:hypothetical protein
LTILNGTPRGKALIQLGSDVQLGIPVADSRATYEQIKKAAARDRSHTASC